MLDLPSVRHISANLLLPDLQNPARRISGFQVSRNTCLRKVLGVIHLRTLLFSLTKKDFEITFFRGSGKGGQHRNKVETGVRILHPESGTVAEACEERSQAQNRRIAFKRLVESPRFKAWHRLRTAAALQGLADLEALRKQMEREVEEWMQPKHLKIEVQKDGKWVEVKE
jgi:protein subunit release factor B